MTIDDFLNRNVDEYLIEDLRKLKRLKPAKGKTAGGAGYPLVMTALAGIELLGALASASTFNKNAGSTYFSDYWKNFLYETDPTRAGLHEIVYQLVRHGLAHVFVMKGDIVVVKGPKKRGSKGTKSAAVHHLAFEPPKTLVLDAAQLADDLIDSYNTRFKAKLAVSRADMQNRLDEMEKAYTNQAANLMSATASPSTASATSLLQNPSGSFAVLVTSKSWP